MQHGGGVCGSVCELSTWSRLPARNLLILPRIYNGVFLTGIAIFYFPQSRSRGHGHQVSAVWKNIDYVGAFLSIAGLTLL